MEVGLEHSLAEAAGEVWQRLAERLEQCDVAGIVLVPHRLRHEREAGRHLPCSLGDSSQLPSQVNTPKTHFNFRFVFSGGFSLTANTYHSLKGDT